MVLFLYGLKIEGFLLFYHQHLRYEMFVRRGTLLGTDLPPTGHIRVTCRSPLDNVGKPASAQAPI
jgi:hypothetical protein